MRLAEVQGSVEAQQGGWRRQCCGNVPGEGLTDNQEEEDGEGRRQLGKAESSTAQH